MSRLSVMDYNGMHFTKMNKEEGRFKEACIMAEIDSGQYRIVGKTNRYVDSSPKALKEINKLCHAIIKKAGFVDIGDGEYAYYDKRLRKSPTGEYQLVLKCFQAYRKLRNNLPVMFVMASDGFEIHYEPFVHYNGGK